EAGGGDGRPGGQAHPVVGGERADQQQDEEGDDDTHGTVSASVALAFGWWEPVCTRCEAWVPSLAIRVSMDFAARAVNAARHADTVPHAGVWIHSGHEENRREERTQPAQRRRLGRGRA